MSWLTRSRTRGGLSPIWPSFAACLGVMLSAAQAVEHYEITRYGTLIAFAQQLGRREVAQVLQPMLQEEKNTDQVLTRWPDSA